MRKSKVEKCGTKLGELKQQKQESPAEMEAIAANGSGEVVDDWPRYA